MKAAPQPTTPGQLRAAVRARATHLKWPGVSFVGVTAEPWRLAKRIRLKAGWRLLAPYGKPFADARGHLLCRVAVFVRLDKMNKTQ